MMMELNLSILKSIIMKCQLFENNNNSNKNNNNMSDDDGIEFEYSQVNNNEVSTFRKQQQHIVSMKAEL